MEETSLVIITVVGALTAFYAAMVACVQVDIKRVARFLYYLADCLHDGIARCGSSRVPPRTRLHGLDVPPLHPRHVQGSALPRRRALIHAIGSNDYTAMHGLRKYMPITHITFLIGCLAIAGIIPFSGFFSKDEILSSCLGYDWVAYLWMSMVAGLTAFYMFRLYFLIFWWKEHKTPEGHHAPHDQPWTMSLPLVILAAVSCVAGSFLSVTSLAGTVTLRLHGSL